MSKLRVIHFFPRKKAADEKRLLYKVYKTYCGRMRAYDGGALQATGANLNVWCDLQSSRPCKVCEQAAKRDFS